MSKSVWVKNYRSLVGYSRSCLSHFQMMKRLIRFNLFVFAILLCSCSTTPNTPEPTAIYDARLEIPELLVEGSVSEVTLPDILQALDPTGINEYRRSSCLQDVLATDYIRVYEEKNKLAVVFRRQWSETISLVKTIEFRLIDGAYQLMEETEIYYRTMPWEMKGNPETRQALIIEAFPNMTDKVEIFAYNANGTGSDITCAEIYTHLADVKDTGWPYSK